MNLLDIVLHLANFGLPALAVALAMWACSRVLGWRSPWSAWRQIGLNASAGLVVLVLGLVLLERDGKMATYAALVLTSGTVQWWATRRG